LSLTFPVAEITAKEGNLHLPENSRLACSGQARALPPRRRVAFLDRDGVINEDIGYLSAGTQLNFLNGVALAIRRLQEHFYIVVVTNQSGIARGYFNEEDLFQVHRHLAGYLENNGAFLDAIYFCPHYPEGAVKSLAINCECRKPQPGMLLRAQRDWDLEMTGSYMVGDQFRDAESAKNAGVTGILLRETSQGRDDNHLSALNLPDATDLILDRNGISKISVKNGELNE